MKIKYVESNKKKKRKTLYWIPFIAIVYNPKLLYKLFKVIEIIRYRYSKLW